MFRTFRVHLEGLSPLLLSNCANSDPLGEPQRLKEHYSSKRRKSEDDHRHLRTLDWLYSCYWATEGQVLVDEGENQLGFEGYGDPYLPSSNFQRCLRNAATRWKLGKATLSAISVTNDPLVQFDGPRDAVGMFNSRLPKYQLSSFTKRGVWVNRCLIPGWEVDFTLTLDDEVIEVDQFRRILNVAGSSEGLGTWRPRYGRFICTAIDEMEVE
jgi:hypothetical protein